MSAKTTMALVRTLAALLAAEPALAAECTARSPGHTVALLELFTSEGCSSCPPADRWLGDLPAAGPLAGKVVPLAQHVDYWDDIGWKDPYAQPGFAARQRRLAAHAGNGLVYTPQFFLQGKVYRPAASPAGLARDLEAIHARPPRADLALALGPAANGKLPVTVTARLRETPAGPAELYVALYENDLSSRVTAGENRGATLRHDFVVRQWIGPRPLPTAGDGETAIVFALPPGREARYFGVAAFVQEAGSLDILQALARPACAGTPGS